MLEPVAGEPFFDMVERLDIKVTVTGGGTTGQAGAIRRSGTVHKRQEKEGA